MNKKLQKQLEALRLPELQAKFKEVTGEESRSPNKTFLIRRIAETLAAAEPAKEGKPSTGEGKPSSKAQGKSKMQAAATTEGSPRGRFSSMTTAELHAMYLQIVGRPTDSESKAYLCWKIREAEKGRIPIGPREGRTAEQAGQQTHAVLPLRMSKQMVEVVDETWRAKGIKSRMEFFRVAVNRYLKSLGVSVEG